MINLTMEERKWIKIQQVNKLIFINQIMIDMLA